MNVKLMAEYDIEQRDVIDIERLIAEVHKHLLEANQFTHITGFTVKVDDTGYGRMQVHGLMKVTD